jgi:dienelactone hydrolase
MRLRTAVAVAATGVVGAGTAALAAGRYGSAYALKPTVAGPAPERLVRVRSVTDGQVVLTRTAASARPGVYGLTAPGVHAVVGQVADHGADGPTVTRSLLRVTRGSLLPGAMVRPTPLVHRGDPRGALGLDHRDVDVPGDLGPLPAWQLPGDRLTWVVLVHGVGATREQALSLMPALHRFRMPQLAVSYRNDPGAPASPDRIGHMGATEWHDLDAALRYAVGQGAERLVLLGWGTGATMALYAAERSAVRDRITGLVLDSPVLDWPATVRAAVRARHLPGALAPLAVRAVEGRTGMRRHPGRDAPPLRSPSVPTMIAHGPGDAFASWDATRALVGLRPETVHLYPVQDAPHAAMWNADPTAYEETLRRFLTPLM